MSVCETCGWWDADECDRLGHATQADWESLDAVRTEREDTPGTIRVWRGRRLAEAIR